MQPTDTQIEASYAWHEIPEGASIATGLVRHCLAKPLLFTVLVIDVFSSFHTPLPSGSAPRARRQRRAPNAHSRLVASAARARRRPAAVSHRRGAPHGRARPSSRGRRARARAAGRGCPLRAAYASTRCLDGSSPSHWHDSPLCRRVRARARPRRRDRRGHSAVCVAPPPARRPAPALGIVCIVVGSIARPHSAATRLNGTRAVEESKNLM